MNSSKRVNAITTLTALCMIVALAVAAIVVIFRVSPESTPDPWYTILTILFLVSDVGYLAGMCILFLIPISSYLAKQAKRKRS